MQEREQYAVGPAWIQEEGIVADSFEELSEIGVAKLHEIGTEVGIVCGPLSTGGLGNALDNFNVFKATIEELGRQGHTIFNQMPFESSLGRLRQRWEAEQEGVVGYCMPILTHFYAPLFGTGRITKSFFIPRWESSFGARWEHEKMLEHTIEIIYLPADWAKTIQL